MAEENGNGNRRRRLMWQLFFALAIFALIAFLYWLIFLRNRVSTDDAYVNGYVATLTAPVSATVTAFYADDSDLVKEGQVLVLLDTTDYALKFEETKTDLSLAVRRVVDLQQTVFQRRDDVRVQRASLAEAMLDFENRKGLVDTLAVSKEEFDHTKLRVDSTKASFARAQHQLDAALTALGTTTLEEHPLVESAKARFREAYVNLKRCVVRAPMTGHVAKRRVEVGDWIKPGSAMMAIVALDSVWVDANFKENQLADLRLDQPVTLSTDIYGRRMTYHGKVMGIVPGSGSVFSLLPPQNASGNWIKIVQRVPVRIHLQAEELKQAPLLLGLSSFVTVDIADRSGKFLTEIPSEKSVGSTDIFQIPMEEAEALIATIIAENR